MTFVRKSILATSFLLSISILPGTASAFDASGNPVADALFAGIEAGKAQIVSVDNVSGSGGRTEILGLTAKFDDEGSTGTLKIGSIVLEDASVSQDGRISAGRFVVTGFSAKKDGTTVTVAELSTDALTLPSAAELKNKNELSDALRYSTATASGISVKPETGGEVPIESITLTTGDIVDGKPTSLLAKIVGLVIAGEVISDPQMRQQIAALGYDQIAIGIDFGGRLDTKSGVMDLHTLKIIGTEMGTLSLTAKLLGITEEIRKKLSGGDQDPKAAMQALQSLIIGGLSIRFDNNSIVERVLDMQAKQMGVTREQLVAQMTGMLPMMLGMLQNPEFQKTVASAATMFLKSPGNLTVTAAPASPVPVAQLIGSAMMAPHTIPTILNVSVTANQ